MFVQRSLLSKKMLRCAHFVIILVQLSVNAATVSSSSSLRVINSLSVINSGEVERCELSLDPEVATLFGREIGQSNGDILLTICDDSKDKSRPVTFV